MADLDFYKVRQYKDLSLTMMRNPVTNDVVAVTGAEAVKRSLRNLINTRTGEVPFFPDFGSTLQQLLFEPMDAITIAGLEASIRATIDAYEPRARITDLVITGDDDTLTYEVNLTVMILNTLDPVTLTLFLKRLR